MNIFRSYLTLINNFYIYLNFLGVYIYNFKIFIDTLKISIINLN